MDNEVAQDIVSSTSLLKEVSRIEHLNKGYSTDKKYVLWEGQKPKFLLRLSEVELYEPLKSNFEMMRRHYGTSKQTP